MQTNDEVRCVQTGRRRPLTTPNNLRVRMVIGGDAAEGAVRPPRTVPKLPCRTKEVEFYVYQGATEEPPGCGLTR